MARKTKEEAALTREAILRAARAVFLERGVAHTALHDIAQAAGVTRGAIYWHFEGKADILRAMADEVFLPYEELLCQLITEQGEDPLGTLERHCLEAIEKMITEPLRRSVFTILTQRCEYCENGEMKALMDRNADCRDRVLEGLRVVMAQAQERRQLAEHWAPITAALALHALFYGLLSMEMEHPAPENRRIVLYRNAMGSLFRSFLPPAPARALPLSA